MQQWFYTERANFCIASKFWNVTQDNNDSFSEQSRNKTTFFENWVLIRYI